VPAFGEHDARYGGDVARVRRADASVAGVDIDVAVLVD
jgi:hypothetical protein